VKSEKPSNPGWCLLEELDGYMQQLVAKIGDGKGGRIGREEEKTLDEDRRRLG
jgi:hypothetical protein